MSPVLNKLNCLLTQNNDSEQDLFNPNMDGTYIENLADENVEFAAVRSSIVFTIS